MPGRRRSTSLLEDLVLAFAELPWWATLIGAGAGLALALLAPRAMGQRSIGAPFMALAGCLIAAAALLGGAVGFARRRSRRRLLDTRGLASISSLSWVEFEQLVGEAYRRRGYRVTETGGGGADGGIDLDLRSADGRMLVQCKHWKSVQVGVREVRELAGVIASLHADGGAIVSTGTFTAAAIDFGRTVRIDLVDGPALQRMLEGLSATNLAQSSEISPAVPSSPARSAACPKCGSQMVRRVARRGSRNGSAFWGCSTYPACRATIEAA